MSVDTLNDVLEFITIAEKQGFKNANTAQGLRTACNKLFAIVDADQQNVQYVSANLPVIKARFQNLNKDVRGQTADVYVRRVELTLAEYERWKTDRAGWERDTAAAARAPRSTEGENAKRTEKPKATATASPPPTQDDPDVRIVRVPLPSGFECEVRLPKDVTLSIVRRIAYALVPLASDWDPETTSPRQVFPKLDNPGDETIRQ